MWTPENRPKYDRSKLRYPSDLTDEEWSIIGPLIPLAKRGGNKRSVDERAVLKPLVEACRPHAKMPPQHLRRTIGAILWRHDNGAKWRALPMKEDPWWMAA